MAAPRKLPSPVSASPARALVNSSPVDGVPPQTSARANPSPGGSSPGKLPGSANKQPGRLSGRKPYRRSFVELRYPPEPAAMHGYADPVRPPVPSLSRVLDAWCRRVDEKCAAYAARAGGNGSGNKGGKSRRRAGK